MRLRVGGELCLLLQIKGHGLVIRRWFPGPMVALGCHYGRWVDVSVIQE